MYIPFADMLGLVKDFVGLDVGNSFVRVAQVRRKESQLTLINYVEVEIFAEKQGEPHESIIAAIERAFSEKKFPKTRVIATATIPIIETTCLRLPVMPIKELKAVVAMKAEGAFSVPLEDSVWCYEVIGETVEKNIRKIEVLVASAQREKVNEQVALYKKAGILPIAISILPKVLFDQYLISTNETQTTALINIGTRVTNVSILEDRILRFTRDIPLGGSHLTYAIQKRVPNVNFEQSERIKKEEGLFSESAGEPLTTSVRGLILEVEKSLDYYRTRAERTRVTKIVLSGATTLLKGFEDEFKKKFDLQIEFADALQGANIPEGIILEEEKSRISKTFNVAIGLTLFKDEGANLLPVQFQRKELTTRQIVMQAFAVLGFIVLLMFSGVMFVRNLVYNRQIQETKKATESMRVTQVNVGDLIKKKNHEEEIEKKLKNVVGKQLIWSQTLKKLAETVPDGLWIEHLSLIPPAKVEGLPTLEIKGFTHYQDLASKFSQDLKTLPNVEDANLEYIRSESSPEASLKVTLSRFQITCSFKPGKS